MRAFVLVICLLAAGCSTEHGTAVPQASPTPGPTSPTTTTAPQLSTYTQAELAQRPCRALDEHDLAALGITEPGHEDSGGEAGKGCAWQVGDQHVTIAFNLPSSYAKTMTKNGRMSQVQVGRHSAVQAEFQRICFIFVGVEDTEHLVGTTTIPDPGAPQDGACPAGASVAAAALTHIR